MMTETTVYMTAGVKKYLLNHSEEIKRVLNLFQSGEYGKSSDRPSNDLIRNFGSYHQLSFGTLWIISYNLFSDREFITLLLPNEYEE